MCKKSLFILLIILMGMSYSFAQKSTVSPKQKLADKLYDRFSFVEAIPVYEELAKKKGNDIHVLSRLADCYRLTDNSVLAEQWYAKVILTGAAQPIHYYYYAQMLQENKKYAEAQKYYLKFSELNAADSRGKKKLTDITDFTEAYKDSSYVRLKLLNINSTYDDFGMFPYQGDEYFFASNKAVKAHVVRLYNWNMKPFLDVYIAKMNSDGTFEQPDHLAKKINTKYHEGPVCYFQPHNLLFLTRNNFFQGKARKSQKGENNLKIFIANYNNKSWTDAIPFEYNNDEYSVGHPTLTSDGKKMYFASDMPGGMGGVDIYVSTWDGTNWGRPENMGPYINTEGNEMFPYVATDTLLYYSSDGFNGFGGLDIFEADLLTGDTIQLKNMGFPLNSSKDDFSFYINDATRSGFFASNRQGGVGGDDIYSFVISKPRMATLTISVINKDTKEPIPQATVSLLNTKKFFKRDFLTDTGGIVRTQVNWDQLYMIDANKEKYLGDTASIKCTYHGSNQFFVELQLVQRLYAVEGFVLNKETNKPIPGAKVTLTDADSKPIDSVFADDKGYYTFPLVEDFVYQANGKKEKYFTNNIVFSTVNIPPGIIKKDIILEEIILNKAIKIENIYYDLAKWNIRPDAATELNKLVKVLKDNPTIEIELSSHTDCRGGDQYNMDLSDKRAKSAAEYVVSQGIDPKRIVGRGYGETMLLNRCKNGVKCSEPEHQENRRTEFKVTKY